MKNNLTKHQKNARRIRAYTFIFIGAIFYSIGLQAFLQNAKTFAVGITALAVLVTYIKDDLTPYVALISLAFNVPLIIFSYLKNNKRFTTRTIFFLLMQSTIGSLFIIEEVRDVFTNIIVDKDELSTKKWAIWILSIIAAVFIGLGISLAWMSGGSTGGTDIVAYYFSSKKQRDLGFILACIAFCFLIFSFSMAITFNKTIQDRWIITLFSSVTFILLSNVIITFVYPKYKKVYLIISSNKIKEIDKALKKHKFWHAWSIEQFKSGYSGLKKENIKTIMFLLESKDFINFIKSIDPDAFIAIQRIYKLYGNLVAKNIEGDF